MLGAARISELSIVGPARDIGARLVAVAARDRERAEIFARRHALPHQADDAVATMSLIDGCYRAIGLHPHPAQA